MRSLSYCNRLTKRTIFVPLWNFWYCIIVRQDFLQYLMSVHSAFSRHPSQLTTDTHCYYSDGAAAIPVCFSALIGLSRWSLREVQSLPSNLSNAQSDAIPSGTTKLHICFLPFRRIPITTTTPENAVRLRHQQ